MLKFLGDKLRSLFQGKIDEEKLEELEQLFYEADLGSEISEELTDLARKCYRKNPSISADQLLDAIGSELLQYFDEGTTEHSFESSPHIILIVGVNGNGKTTSIAKLAHLFKEQGKSVLVAAGDTFRAAAIEQLTRWAERLGIEIVKAQHGADPASVAYDAVEAAKSRGIEIVLIDTAGRLHTKHDLMQELEKIKRVAKPHETLLVLDATIGQNGLEQAATFHQVTPLSGLILTKVDGTAKGGAALAIQRKLKLPIRYLGSGEGIKDFAPFDAKHYVDTLIGKA